MSDLERALDYAVANRERFLAEYRGLLAIPSISTLPEHTGDVERTAKWLADALEGLGMDGVAVMPTAGHPVVFGEWCGAAGKPTVLVYGHYDVQPVDPLDEWESDPFAAEVRGDYVYARGASDMKGQLFALLKAIESLLQQGPIPVNIKFMLEGEEEVGSPNLADFIAANKEQLACDFVLNADSGILSPAQPSITYALRGLAYFEIMLQGPGHDLHSGMFGGSIHNPIHVLCELIGGMHDEDGRVSLPGFYERVRELDREERDELANLPYSDEEWSAMTGAEGLHGEAGYSTIERVGARPALDVNGIWGGFSGAGAKTVLPAKAFAKLSMRLVADQKSADVEGQLRAYIEENVPEGVRWEVTCHAGGPGAIMDRHSSYVTAAVGALKESFGAAPLFKREGGSVPVVGLMQELLGVDSVMLGFALPDDGIHGPNERQYLPNVWKGIAAYARFLAAL